MSGTPFRYSAEDRQRILAFAEDELIKLDLAALLMPERTLVFKGTAHPITVMLDYLEEMKDSGAESDRTTAHAELREFTRRYPGISHINAALVSVILGASAVRMIQQDLETRKKAKAN